MINSFWNICSTCPMPREEKLNSEYKRNFVWHPQYKPLSQDVVSIAPHSVTKDIMQRKKQYPELAHRSHEVIRHDLGHSMDSRARSEERDANLSSRSGPRSRSAEPSSHQQQKLIMIQSFPPIASGRVAALPKTDEATVSEFISETSEYQSQFAWPKPVSEKLPCTARKSVSMGVIKGTDEADIAAVPKVKLAPVHRPCVKQKNLQIMEKSSQDSKKKNKTEYKAKYKPFTSYVYIDGQWKKTSRLLMIPEKKPEVSEEPWFVEVVERLQKANEYRWRGHGHSVYGETLPDIYKQPVENVPHRSRADLQLPLPKVHEGSRKGETKKKDSHLETVAEKKRDKEAKPAPTLRRPKSAEPAKAKEQVKHKRPATTPPAKMTTAQVYQIRKGLSKEKDAKTKASKPSTSRKPKDESKKLPGKKTQNSPHNASMGSGGKVWLQAGQNISEHPAVDDPAPRERTDAVRPSSLLPAPPAPLSEEPAQQSSANSNHTSAEIADAPVHPIVHHSVVPLTHVRTPEEVTGVKSPDPENWTVPIESNERLEWSGVNAPSITSPKSTKFLTEQKSEKDSEIPTSGEIVHSAASAPSSAKLTSANVLDRARNRLDQFWGKNK